MRPVSAEFPVSQEFGSFATAGVVADSQGSEVQQLVAAYGNYQPFGHAGQDIACPIGTPVHAIADGTVLYAGWAEDLPGDDSWSPSGYFQRWALYKYFGGIVTVLQHNGWKSVTAHQSNNDAVSVGDWVTEGQIIGATGNTKTRTTQVAPHVHIEALVDDSYSTGNGLIYGRTDPIPYFGGITAQSGTVTPLEDDMPTPKDLWDYPITLDGKDYAASDVLRYARLNAAQANEKADAALKAITGLLGTRLPAPDGSGHSYTLAEYITYGWAYGMNAGPRTLGQEIRLGDGTVTSLASLLAAIYQKPAGAPASVDVDALVARLKAELPAATVTALATQLAK